jgi:hypothetical protein
MPPGRLKFNVITLPIRSMRSRRMAISQSRLRERRDEDGGKAGGGESGTPTIGVIGAI